MHAGFNNTILKTLHPDIIHRLQLSKVMFELGHEIEFPGQPIDRIYFVEQGMASMTTTFHDGSQVEVGMFGYESIIGVSALMGSKRSLNRVYTQVAGWGYASSIDLAYAEFRFGGKFQQLALRYVQAQLLQAAQSTGCNVKHEIQQRLARWLLLTADRVHKNTFEMPHEFLADMLGSTRSTVSTAAKLLKEQNLIAYTRGRIRILDPVGLEKESCECYRAIKNHLDNFLEFDSGIVA